MGLGAKPRKGLSLPAPNSEHTFQQLLQGPLQGRILSNLRGTLRGRAIAHHLDPRDNFQNHCYYPLLSISALHFQSHDLNNILCRDMTSKKKKKKKLLILFSFLEKRRKILLEREDTCKITRFIKKTKRLQLPASGSSSRSCEEISKISRSSSLPILSPFLIFIFIERREEIKLKRKKKKKKMSAHAPPGTREPETKALLFRGGCLQPARGMRLAALTHWLPAKSFFFHSPFPSAPPSLPPPSSSSSQPAVFSSGLTSGGNIQNLCLCACTCIIVESRYSNPLLSKLYLDDTGSMLPVRLRGREGKSSMDAVFGVIIEYGIERGGRGLGGGSWFSNIWR